MSFTSKLISDDPADQPFIQFIQEHLPQPKDFKTTSPYAPFSKEYTLRVPQQLNNEEEARQLHMAFTYLFQLDVVRQTNTPFRVEELLATKGYRLIKKHYKFHLPFDYQYANAKTRIDSYIHTVPYTAAYNKMATQIYGACFLFAQLDYVARTKAIPLKIDKDFLFLPQGSFTKEFEDLEDMAFERFVAYLTPKDEMVLHPTFGLGSKLVGGANADMIINDTLIEIITTDVADYKWTDIAHVVGYYLLNKLNTRYADAHDYSFSKVGLYRARFGEMEYINLDEYFGDKLPEIVEKLHSLLE